MVTSVCWCLFRASPSSDHLLFLQPGNYLHWFVTTTLTWLHAYRPFPFILIDGLVLSSRKKRPYQPRHGLSIVNLIDVYRLDLGHCISCEAPRHSPRTHLAAHTLLLLWCNCFIVLLCFHLRCVNVKLFGYFVSLWSQYSYRLRYSIHFRFSLSRSPFLSWAYLSCGMINIIVLVTKDTKHMFFLHVASATSEVWYTYCLLFNLNYFTAASCRVKKLVSVGIKQNRGFKATESLKGHHDVLYWRLVTSQQRSSFLTTFSPLTLSAY